MLTIPIAPAAAAEVLRGPFYVRRRCLLHGQRIEPGEIIAADNLPPRTLRSLVDLAKMRPATADELRTASVIVLRPPAPAPVADDVETSGTADAPLPVLRMLAELNEIAAAPVIVTGPAPSRVAGEREAKRTRRAARHDDE